MLMIGRVLYAAVDWGVSAGLGSFVFWMSAMHFSQINIFLATWLYDLVVAATFFFASDMTGCDYTMGNSFRRVADSFMREGFWGKMMAGLLVVGLSLKAIIWEGPEVICFIFKKELKTKTRLWGALISLSAFQGMFGSWLYTTGYDLWQKYSQAGIADSHFILMGIATFAIFVIVCEIGRRLAGLIMKMFRRS